MKKIIILIFLMFLNLSCSKEAKKVEIIYAGLGDPAELKIMQDVLKEFEKENPGIKVRFDHTPGNAYWEKLQTMIAGGVPPDVAYMGGEYLSSLANKGVLMELDELIKNDKEFEINDFYPQILEMFKWRGKIYGIPRDLAPLVLFYNRELFDKEGLKYPSENWKWEDLLEVSRKLTKDFNNDGIIDQFGYLVACWWGYYLPFVWQNGGDLFKPDFSECLVDRKEFIEAIQFYADMLNKYKVAPSLAARYDADLFQTSRLGMQIACYWQIPFYSRDGSLNWDVAAVPGKKMKATLLSGAGYSILKGCKNVGYAWKLVKYLTSAKVQKYNASQGLAVPALKTVAESEEFLSKPKNRVFVEAIKYAKPAPFNPKWNEIASLLDRELEQVFLGKAKADVVCKKVKPKIDALLKEIK